MSRIDESLAELPTLLTNADLTIVDLRHLINRDVVPLAREATQTLVVARDALQSLSTTITEESLVQVSSTLTEFEKTLQLLQERLDANEPLMHELTAALREIGDAARSVRDLADALEEHPESLVRGKSSQ